MFYRCRTFLIFIIFSSIALAQMPSEQLLKRAHKIDDDVGDDTVVVASKSFLMVYPELEGVFKEAERKIEQAQKRIRYYQRNKPDTDYEWKDFLNNRRLEQEAREVFQNQVRITISSRLDNLEDYMREELDIAATTTANKELGELRNLYTQLNEVKRVIDGRISSGTIDVDSIEWPTLQSEEYQQMVDGLRKSLRLVLRSNGRAIALKRWNKLVNKLDETLSDNLEEMQKEVQWAGESVREEANHVQDELDMLGVGEMDLNRNAVMQGVAAAKYRMSEQLYKNWKALNK